jgi:DNA-directed RNA polymerase subunit RPC12/RpoP
VEIVPLNCNNCGATLDVGPQTNFVTCTHCGARLAVKRTATSAYTEILEKIDQKTDAIAAQLAEIARHNELERLDREWERERASLLVRGKHGQRHVPTDAVAVVTAGGAAVFGVFWIGAAASIGAPSFMFLMGGMVVVLAIGMAVWQVGAARRYREAQARYERRRAALLEAGKPDPDSTPA